MNLISLYSVIDSGDESMLLDIYLFYNFSSQFICQMVEESCYIIYGVPGEVDGLSVGFRGTNIIIRWVGDVEVGCKSPTERQVVSVIYRILGTYCSQMYGLSSVTLTREIKERKKGRIA